MLSPTGIKHPIQPKRTKPREKEGMRRWTWENLLLGLIIGIIAITGYSISSACWMKVLFLCLLMGAASFVAGFFLGFLFGIPRRATEGGEINAKMKYTLNNNLMDISDWLTKIIIGVGLVEIKSIPASLQDIGEYVYRNLECSGKSISVFVVCDILYFSVFGLYFGYNYMRLFLSGEYADADDYLLAAKAGDINTRGKAVDVFNQEIISEIENDPLNIENIERKQKEFDELLGLAKRKLDVGKVKTPDDPQKGMWGGVNEKNNRMLNGTVSPFENSINFFKVILTVQSTDQKNYPMKEGELVIFGLQDTFPEPIRAATVKNGLATIEVIAYRAFTVGALIAKERTELELDLMTVDAPSVFKAN